MQTIDTVSRLRAALNQHKRKGETIAFVPTMGNLHEGHLSLIDTAKARADIVVCSVFVNPTQFGENEDFSDYPRTLTADQEKLVTRGCDYLFTPSVKEMYPDGDILRVNLSSALTEQHCGASRPGHFSGVATVVSKLFNIVQPDVAIFGKKDYQQLAVIRQLTNNLFLPIQIIGVETHRESSGLARSSRNQYLSESEHDQAGRLRQVLQRMATSLADGQSIEQVVKEGTQTLRQHGFQLDYVNVVDQVTLSHQNSDQLVILAAAFLGDTRLIDNIEVNR